MSIWDDTEHPDTAKVRELQAEVEQLRDSLTTVVIRRDEIERLRTEVAQWRVVAEQQEKMIGQLQVENQELKEARHNLEVRLNAELRASAGEVKRLQDRLASINANVWGVGPGPGWPT